MSHGQKEIHHRVSVNLVSALSVFVEGLENFPNLTCIQIC